MNRHRRKLLMRIAEAVAVGLVVLNLVLYFALVRPLRNMRLAAESESSATRTRVQEAKARVSRLEQYRVDVPKSETELKEFLAQHVPERRQGFSHAARMVRKMSEDSKSADRGCHCRAGRLATPLARMGPELMSRSLPDVLRPRTPSKRARNSWCSAVFARNGRRRTGEPSAMKEKGKTEKWITAGLGVMALVLVVNLIFRGKPGAAPPKGIGPASTAAARPNNTPAPSDELTRFDPALQLDEFKAIQKRPASSQRRNPFEFVTRGRVAPTPVAQLRTYGAGSCAAPPPPLKRWGIHNRAEVPGKVAPG
jgi:hypothetical protein